MIIFEKNFLSKPKTCLSYKYISNTFWVMVLSDALSTVPVLSMNIPERKKNQESDVNIWISK